MKKLFLFTIILCGLLLLWSSGFLPDFRDPDSPPNRNVSAYYIEHAESDTATPNMVAAILADYRGFDTMFETAVIFAAGLAVFVLLWGLKGSKPKRRSYRHQSSEVVITLENEDMQLVENSEFKEIDSIWVPTDLIIQNTCRIMVPLILIYALYILVFGHHSPGGGFQAGVIFGAAFILIGVSFSISEVMKILPPKRVFILSAVGVLIYVGTGLLALFSGGNFLDYGALGWLFGTEGGQSHSDGIMLVEIGVTMAVSMVMVGLYYSIASLGNIGEGL